MISLGNTTPICPPTWPPTSVKSFAKKEKWKSEGENIVNKIVLFGAARKQEENDEKKGKLKTPKRKKEKQRNKAKEAAKISRNIKTTLMNTPFAYKAARWCRCCCCQALKDKRRGAAQVSLRGVGRGAHTHTHSYTHLQRLCGTRRQRWLRRHIDDVNVMNVARCRWAEWSPPAARISGSTCCLGISGCGAGNAAYA